MIVQCSLCGNMIKYFDADTIREGANPLHVICTNCGGKVMVEPMDSLVTLALVMSYRYLIAEASSEEEVIICVLREEVMRLQRKLHELEKML